MRYWPTYLLLFLCAALFMGPAQASDQNDNGRSLHWLVEDHLLQLKAIKKSKNIAKLEEARDALRGMPTREAYETIVTRFSKLPGDTQLHESPKLVPVVQLLGEVLMGLGSSADLEMIARVDKWFAENISEPQIEKALLRLVTELSSINSGGKGLPSVSEVNEALISGQDKDGRLNKASKALTARPEAYKKAHRRALNKVTDFYNYMSDRVIGQKEVLEALEALYLKDMLANGDRSRPEVIYLLGLPGNGKDTIVESYVDALYEKEGAHEKHLYRMNIRTKEEAWSLFGSGKGYVGSGELPDFLRFLVEHSWGRYTLGVEKDGNNERLVVERNPNWKPGTNGSSGGGAQTVIFINEAHNIPKDVKDNILKQAIERGIFPITNPGQGPNAASEIKLNATFIFASNEGIDLLEPRQKNGMRVGQPLSYERLYDNWQRTHGDKTVLKQAILKNNGEINDSPRGNMPGTSEEFLNRIPDDRVFLLKPLSPDGLFEVAQIEAQKQGRQIEKGKGALGRYRVRLSDNVIRFITEHNYIPSENARPIEGRLKGLVFREIYRAIKRERIRPLGTEQDINIDVRKYKNGAVSLVFEITDRASREVYSFNRLIRETLSNVAQPPLPQERVNELLVLREKIVKNVFGVEHIVDRLIESAIVSESEARNSGESQRPATVMAFLGKTSTGKTETAKQYVKARYGEAERPNVIDFNGVRSLDAMEAKILGSYDSRKNPIASDFMKAYDRAPDGNIAFIFDEAANSPKELLKGLYEILREPVVTGFADGKPRSMKNVTIILTGNAGEEIYRNIPQSMTREIRERALHQVFQMFISDEHLQQKILEKTFPEALIARIGRNIYHFGPLTNQGKRQIGQLKLLKGLETLRPKKSERGWNFKFGNEADLLRAFDMIEKEGYHVSHQGASIDKFVREQLIDRIKAKLITEGVRSGSDVIIEVVKETDLPESVRDKQRQVRLTTIHGKEFLLDIPVSVGSSYVTKTGIDRALVGYHEVGHEIVSEVYLGDRVRPQYLSIINGVTQIDGNFVAYNGIRAGVMTNEIPTTKQALLRHVAGLIGGYKAQQIVTLGGRHDGGKSNDMHRATKMIQDGILRFGLSDSWGKRAIPEGVATEDFIGKELSTQEKQNLNKLTDRWLRQAEILARDAILLNLEGLFHNMSKELIEKGFLKLEDIQRIYSESPLVTEHDSFEYEKRLAEIKKITTIVDKGLEAAGESFHKKFPADVYTFGDADKVFKYLFRKSQGLSGFLKSSPWSDFTSNQKLVAASYMGMKLRDEKRDARLSLDYWYPEKVADIFEFIEEERKKETREVTRFSDFDFLQSVAKKGKGLRCHHIFAQ